MKAGVKYQVFMQESVKLFLCFFKSLLLKHQSLPKEKRAKIFGTMGDKELDVVLSCLAGLQDFGFWQDFFKDWCQGNHSPPCTSPCEQVIWLCRAQGSSDFQFSVVPWILMFPPDK